MNHRPNEKINNYINILSRPTSKFFKLISLKYIQSVNILRRQVGLFMIYH